MPDETNQTPRIGQTGVEDKTLTGGTICYDIRFKAYYCSRLILHNLERLKLLLN